jgi:hypothetical protein
VKACSRQKALDLPLDVDLLEGLLFGAFEEAERFTSEESYFAVFFTLLEECLTAIITDESGTFVIGLETEFLCEEA